MKLQFLNLMQKKEQELGRRISYADIADETGLTRAVVSKWASGKVVSYRQDMINVFCGYFGCEVGDLIVYEPDKAEAKPEPQP